MYFFLGGGVTGRLMKTWRLNPINTIEHSKILNRNKSSCNIMHLVFKITCKENWERKVDWNCWWFIRLCVFVCYYLSNKRENLVLQGKQNRAYFCLYFRFNHLFPQNSWPCSVIKLHKNTQFQWWILTFIKKYNKFCFKSIYPTIFNS